MTQVNKSFNEIANDKIIWSRLVLIEYSRWDEITQKTQQIHPKILCRNTYWKQNPNSLALENYRTLKKKLAPIQEKLWENIKPWKGDFWECTLKPSLEKPAGWVGLISIAGGTVGGCVYGGIAASQSGTSVAATAIFLGLAGCFAGGMIGVPAGFLLVFSINGCYHLFTVPLSNSLEATNHAETLLQIARYGNVEITLDVPPPSLSMQK